MSITSSQEVLRVQIATGNAESPVGAEVMAAQMGRNSRTSESVQVTPNQADLSDSLEELGMAAATRGKVDVDKLKLRKGAGTSTEALGRIAEYYDKLPSMPSDQKRRDLVLQFKQFEDFMKMQEGGGGGSGSQPTAQDILKALINFDPDISHQFAALENIREQAAASGAPASYLALLDQVRSDMRDPDKLRDIMAGFASAREAVTVGDKFGTDPATYRESYRALLRESPKLGRVFDELTKFSLTENFDSVIGSFLKVAGDDMSSFGPSTDPAQLGDVVRELTNLKNLRTVLQSAQGVLDKVERQYPSEGDSTRPKSEDVASRMFHFSGAPVASMADAEGLVRGFETSRPEVPVMAVNLLRELHAQLPDVVVHSPQARDQQSRMLLNLSTRLVEIEEAAFGGQVN